MSIRERILSRMAAALLGATDAGVNVFRSREVSITREVSPAIVLMPAEEDDEPYGDTVDYHELIVNVEIFARGDPWDSLIDGVAQQVHKILSTDPGLAALSSFVRKIRSKWEGQEADATAGVLTMAYKIVYLTRSADIDTAP